MPDGRHTEAVQKVDFAQWANGPARLPEPELDKKFSDANLRKR